MAARQDRFSDIGVAELEVLKALWDHGPQTVREVLTVLHRLGRQVAYTTVQTMLTRLEKKGFVRSRKDGVAHIFRAAITRERITQSRLRALLAQLYDGAAGPLVLHLVRNEQLSAEELRQLQKLIESLDSTGKKPPAPPTGRDAS